jgi:AraC-like DNA-binding protein
LKMLGRQHFRPRYASLALPIKRQEARLLEERLGCKVKGKASANSITFSTEMLNLPVATSNRTLYSLLSNGLTQLRAASKASLIEQVETNVRRGVLEGHCALDSCADGMGTSARTLQKRLKKVDIKFMDIVQSERIKLAKHSLRWSDSTLDEIALQLGYAEQSSFGRAFKRSTGFTPKEFRRQQAC